MRRGYYYYYYYYYYLANEALAFILASDSDSNDSFGDESSLDSSNCHDSEEEPCFRAQMLTK